MTTPNNQKVPLLGEYAKQMNVDLEKNAAPMMQGGVYYSLHLRTVEDVVAPEPLLEGIISSQLWRDAVCRIVEKQNVGRTKLTLWILFAVFLCLSTSVVYGVGLAYQDEAGWLGLWLSIFLGGMLVSAVIMIVAIRSHVKLVTSGVRDQVALENQMTFRPNGLYAQLDISSQNRYASRELKFYRCAASTPNQV